MTKPHINLALAAVLSVLAVTGCSSTSPADTAANSDLLRRTEALRSQEQLLQGQQKALEVQTQATAAREAQVAQREEQLNAQTSRVQKPVTAESTVTPAQAMQREPLLPPNAKPGECYARVYSPPTYRTVTEQMLKRAESSKVDVIPAKYQSGTERVLVKPATKVLRVIPATYEWVEERVLARPATKRLVEVPAKMEQQTERVMVAAGYTTWKKGTGPIQKVDQSTGEIMCLVEVPPVYKNLTKTVQVAPASVRSIEVPAVYKIVRKQVLKTPATTVEQEVPAEYKTVSVNKLVEPAREVVTPIQAQYQTVSRREMVSPGGLQWREILCETNMTRTRVMEIQSALKAAGHNPGPIDGRVMSGTMSAVNAYQKAKGLPVDEYLNVETVRSLGVLPR